MIRGREIDPDEVLLDSSNLPRFDRAQFEGRLEKPISRASLFVTGGSFAVIAAIFIFQAANLQIVHGEEYRERSQSNMLRPVPIFASRGAIHDRNGMPLAWNSPADRQQGTSSSPYVGFIEDSVPSRMYATSSGLAHLLGYVQYPSKDNNGFYYRNDFEGVAGVEKYYDKRLTGSNGSRLIEVDARGSAVSHVVIQPPRSGETIELSVDGRVQAALHRSIAGVASTYGFSGGAGVIMDVHTGELIALTSYPEYSPQMMSDKTDSSAVRAALNDPALVFLDRAVGGLYTPGSVLKPYVAIGALNDKVIEPSTVIHTTGQISVQNMYDPTVSNIFRDWKNHGSVDMRRAIAVSSDVYFYAIGGGYKDQKGMGIVSIDRYLTMFGFGQKIPESFASGPSGVIPTPEWKKKTFDEDWFLGNTYHTVIGQYGTQVTPVQIVRAVAALANRGTLLVPTVLAGEGPIVEKVLDLPAAHFVVVNEGMRMAVKEGTGVALNVQYTEVAAKSGTAELGVSKSQVNSWITGFWPYEEPRYAFAVLLEKGSVKNLVGAAAAMRQQLDWMHLNTPEYF